MKYSTICFVLENELGATIFTHQKLEKHVYTSPSHSSSVILSLSNYLVQQFPTLIPPGVDAKDIVSQALTVNIWMNLFVQTIQKQNALRHNDVLYLKINIDKEYYQRLISLQFKGTDFEKFNWKNCSASLLNQNILDKPKNKTILLCLCNESVQYTHVRNFSLAAIHLGIFFNNQKWKIFKIAFGQFPTPQQLQSASIIIVPGSDLSILDVNTNIQTFKSLFINAIKVNPKLKYVGICFGMQLICSIFGGKVAKGKNHIAQVQKLTLNKQILKKYSLHQDWQQHDHLTITSIHGDQVVQVPDIFQILAHSDTCGVQIVISKCNKYFGLQGHPDYPVDFLQQYLFSRQDNDVMFNHSSFKDEFVHTRKAISSFLSIEDN